MRGFVRWFFPATLFLFTLSLLPGSDAREQGHQLQILFTHDLHSWFEPRVVENAGGIGAEGGFARLAALIRSHRAADGAPRLVVDAGDFSMGTAFHTLTPTDAAELRFLGRAGYDVATFGNHDFDFHPYNVARMLRAARASGDPLPLLVESNLRFGATDRSDSSLRNAFAEIGVRDYAVVERGGLRIGLFGLMGRDAAEDAPYAAPITFGDIIGESKRVTAVLRDSARVDLVVCLSHSGTSPVKTHSEDELLAAAVPGIDVIISGHTHTVLERPIIVGSTIVVSAGCFGANLGVLDIRRTAGERWTVDRYALERVRDDLPQDTATAAWITTLRHAIDARYFSRFGYAFDTVLATAPATLPPDGGVPRNSTESGLGDLLTDAFRFAVKKSEGARYRHVHFAVEGMGIIRDALLKGPVRANDVFRVLSLGLGPDSIAGYPLTTAWVTGADLENILEAETSIAPMKPDARLQISGVRMTYNPHRIIFDRTMKIEVEEEDGTYRALDRSKLYRVCMNAYMVKLVDVLGGRTHGLIGVDFRDADGTIIRDHSTLVLRSDSSGAGVREWKEWDALAQYIASFPDIDGDGVPDIPARYRAPEGRIVVEASWNPVALLEGATWITFTCIGLTIAVLALLALLVRFLVRRFR